MCASVARSIATGFLLLCTTLFSHLSIRRAAESKSPHTHAQPSERQRGVILLSHHCGIKLTMHVTGLTGSVAMEIISGCLYYVVLSCLSGPRVGVFARSCTNTCELAFLLVTLGLFPHRAPLILFIISYSPLERMCMISDSICGGNTSGHFCLFDLMAED